MITLVLATILPPSNGSNARVRAVVVTSGATRRYSIR